MRRPLKLLLTWIIGIISVALLCCIAGILWIYLSAKPHEYTTLAALPHERVGIVFGAEVIGTELSPILQDRVDGGIALYKNHTVDKLLMTGDNSEIDYNEVVAMQKYAIAHGVPATDITLDYAGFTTFDSCYRAHAIFNVSQAILITQQYHMPRALFLCRHLGIDAIGYALPDFSKYPNLRVPYTIREWGADLKAWWQISVNDQPKYLGQQVPIK